MKCPKCQLENPEGLKFCNRCGNKLEVACPKCGNMNVPGSNFCGECGDAINLKGTLSSKAPIHDPLPSTPPKVKFLDGERKHATVLFSDLSGYTAISEKLDPEIVKEIMGRIFNEAAKVAEKYDATVEKFFGDEIMILLGVPKAHEDDPVRAINVAIEIHEQVTKINPEYEKETGVSLTMHTGINTGLVITGDKYIGKSRHGLTGDTINLAKRLTGLAESGEIVVGPDTYHQSSGYFSFEDLKPMEVNGKAEPVQAYRVISPKAQPRKIHRLQGFRAKLIGRKVELGQLQETAKRLWEGQGTVFSIVGTAGTGKSRLIDEFKQSLNIEEIQWREGHAYPYTQNIPYFPLINLLSRAFGIKEGDSPEKMREKIENGVTYLMGEDQEAAPYIGSLFSLSYPEIDEVSPEFWKSKLQQSILAIISAFAKMGPTVICLEDLHWADPSFLELIRHILSNIREPVLFLCIYRPIITLFSSHQITSMSGSFQEIGIQDLSASESQDMLESLLNTENIPDELRRFVQTKVEGNPFYLEEMINSLIESETLIREKGNWHATQPITEADIAVSIHGLITARLDRLDLETKQILQQAAVIGRVFYYEILKKITDLKGNIDGYLIGLEDLDLIKTRSIEPDLEYMFKHPLTQEVVYNGLLKKDRKSIHEQIAIVMEQLFQDRLPEFYESLAFHFKQGQSVSKAVDYLIKSAEKCLGRYALEESHLYFKQAFDILSEQPNETKEKEERIIDVLLGWVSVYHHFGDFSGLVDLLRAHEELAEHLNDGEKRGMFYAWLGHALQNKLKLNDGRQYLLKALKLGEDIENLKVVGHSCAMLSIISSELGLLDKAVAFGKRSKEISLLFPSDRELVRHSFIGLGLVYYFRGESRKAYDIGKELIDYGQSHYDLPSDSIGYQLIGISHLVEGDFPKAIESFQTAIEISVAPWFSQSLRILLGMSYISCKQIEAAENTLKEVMTSGFDFGDEIIRTAANLGLGIVSITKGELSRGVRIVEHQINRFFETDSRYRYAVAKYMLGKVYLNIAQRSNPISIPALAKNIGFVMRNVPFASKKAEYHLNKSIQVAKEIGAKGVLGQSYLCLGELYKKKGRSEPARKCILKAIDIFEERGAEIYLKQAYNELESLQ